jgi:hypothetical protein
MLLDSIDSSSASTLLVSDIPSFMIDVWFLGLICSGCRQDASKLAGLVQCVSSLANWSLTSPFLGLPDETMMQSPIVSFIV